MYYVILYRYNNVHVHLYIFRKPYSMNQKDFQFFVHFQRCTQINCYTQYIMAHCNEIATPCMYFQWTCTQILRNTPNNDKEIRYFSHGFFFSVKEMKSDVIIIKRIMRIVTRFSLDNVILFSSVFLLFLFCMRSTRCHHIHQKQSTHESWAK